MLFSWADFSPDFSPLGLAFMLSSARWFLPPGGCIFCSDWVVPPCAASLRFVGVADEGAACSVDGALRSVPVPCALANPVPAISAAAATDIIKRLVMEYLLMCSHCPRRQRKEMRDVPRCRRFHRLCFVNAR